MALVKVSGQVWQLHDGRRATAKRVVAVSNRLRDSSCVPLLPLSRLISQLFQPVHTDA